MKKYFFVLACLTLLLSTAMALTVPINAMVKNENGSPLNGANVTYDVGNNTYNRTTNSNGITYPVRLESGTQYTLTVSKEDYETQVLERIVPNTQNVHVDRITLSSESPTQSPPQDESGLLFITVKKTNGQAIEGARVYVYSADSSDTQYTDRYGETAFEVVKGNNYTIEASAAGYNANTQTIYFSQDRDSYSTTITLSQTQGANFSQNVQVRAYVTNQNGTPLSGASVSYTADGYNYPGGTTQNGYANPVTLQPSQSGTATASLSEYNTQTTSFTVGNGPSQTVYLTLSSTISPPPTSVLLITKVINNSNNTAIQGASVNYNYSGTTTSAGTTDYQGFAQSQVTPNAYVTITASAGGFNTGQTTTYSPSSGSQTVFIYLSPTSPPQQNTFIIVRVTNNSNGSAVSPASVTINAQGNNYNLTTDSTGQTNGIYLPANTSGTVQASAGGFYTNSTSFVTQSSGTQTIQIGLSQISTPPNPTNNNPTISGIPNIEIQENSGFHNDIIDLWGYASDSEDSDSQLDFSISQSNTNLVFCFVDNERFIDCEAPRDDWTGSSTITVTVRDRQGNTDQETFTVFVREEDDFDNDNEPPRIDDIPNQHVEENSGFQNNLVDLRDYASDDDTSLDELSFSISESNTGLIDCFVDQDRFIDCQAPSRNRTGSSTITVTARDPHGRTDTESFRVIVEDEDDFDDNDNDDSICSDIRISTVDLFVPENKTTTKNIRISNENSRRFEVESVTVTDTSPDYTVSVVDDDFTISGNSSKDLALKFNAKSVSSSKKSTIRVRLSGEFSNRDECHINDVDEQIDVTVQNSSFESQVNINPFPRTIEMFAGESKTARLTIENDFSSTKCFELSVSSNNSFVSASVTDDDFCIKPRQSNEVQVAISASTNAPPQTSTVQVKAEYDNGSKFEFIAIKIVPQTIEPVQTMDATIFNDNIELQDDQTKSFDVTITNTSGNDLTNIALTMTGLPQGVSFNPVFIQRLPKDSATTASLQIQSEQIQEEGTFTSLVEVSADQGKITRPITINLSKKSEEQKGPEIDGTGLVGLAQLAAGGLILLLVLTLFVVLIVALVRKK